jgi:hypothetical protein
MELLKWLFGTRNPALNKSANSIVSCGCEDKKLYDVDVFGGKQSQKMKLCKDHIRSKCEEGFLVAL